MSNNILWKIDKQFDKLRKEIYTHAKTRVPKYRWIRGLDLEQSTAAYLEEIQKGIPTQWVDELCNARIKVADRYGADWMIEHLINIPEEVKKAFDKAWGVVGTKPAWVGVACSMDGQDQGT